MSTKLHLECDGVDASTLFVDSGPSAHTVSSNGNAQIDTAESKFGGASGLFDGNGDDLSIPDSADFDFIATVNDYSLGIWAKTSGAGGPSGDRYLVTQREDAGNRWFLNHNASGYLNFEVISSSATILSLSGGTISDDAWHWIAVIKVGIEYGLYLDGVQVAYLSDASMRTFAGQLLIGNISVGDATRSWDGWLDDIFIADSNIHGAAPNAGLTDTITVPTSASSSLSVSSSSSLSVNPIFHWEPDYNSIVSGVKFDTQVTTIKSDAEQRRAKISKPRYHATLNFINYLETRGDLSAIGGFFNSRRGRFDWFWLPSFKHDTYLTQNYTTGTKIYVENNTRFTDVSNAHGNYVYIFDGTNYEVKQVTSTGNDGGGDFIFIRGGFDNPYTILSAKGQKVWVQIAYKVRFVSDTYEDNNIADYVQSTAISFIEVL